MKVLDEESSYASSRSGYALPLSVEDVLQDNRLVVVGANIDLTISMQPPT